MKSLLVRGSDTVEQSKGATGARAHSEGNSSASGNFAHAEGNTSIASSNAAHAEGSNCTASGANSHAEGNNCTASGANSHAEGSSCSASGDSTHAAGNGSTASGLNSRAAGANCSAVGFYSDASGHRAMARRSSERARSSGNHSSTGDRQSIEMYLFGYTTNATPFTLTAGAGSLVLTGAGTNVYTVLTDCAAMFELVVVARRSNADEVSTWQFRGAITRPLDGVARLVGGAVAEVAHYNDAAAATWSVAVTADTTDNYLKVSCTGQAAKSIGWAGYLRLTEVIYPA